MTFSYGKRFAPAALAVFAAATFASACSRDEQDLVAPRAEPARSLQVAVEVSNLAAKPGDRVAVAIRTRSESPLGGLQGRLQFNPSSLRFIGQEADAEAVSVINADNAGRGQLSIVTVNPRARALPERTAVLTFEVVGGSFTSGLEYVFGMAGDPENSVEIRRARTIGVVEALDLAASPEAKVLSDDDWARVVDPVLFADGQRIMGAPGELISGLVYGDCNVSGGALNVFDVLCVQRVAANLDQPISGSNAPDKDVVLAGNVAPANLPGIGEAGDAIPPGVDAGGSSGNIDRRSINVFDALDVANEVAGNDRVVVGAIIPGREAAQFARGVQTVVCPLLPAGGTLTFKRDSIYRIQKPANPATDVCAVGSNSGGGTATLIIEPGTRIEVDSNTIVINRNAQIQAIGTVADPIVFTCATAPVVRGCWGGIYINGNAPVNNGTTTSPVIAGRNGGGAREAIGEGNSGLYGGDNASDNSGTIKFAIFEGAGTRFTTTNERNSLTLNAVGSGTVIDYVQIDLGLDDGIEWFGGTVNVKHAIVSNTEDDSFDWAGGWQGKGQFFISTGCSTACDNGIEADNFGIDGGSADPEAIPNSAPTLYNLTLLGVNNPTAAFPSPGFHGMLIRQNTAGTFRNLLVFGYKAGFDVDSSGQASTATPPAGKTIGAICTKLGGAGSQGQTVYGTDSLSVRFAYFGQNTADGDGDSADPRYQAGTSGVLYNCGGYGHSGSDLEAQYIAASGNSLFPGQGNATTHLVDPWGAVPDFRILASSPIASATCATPPSDGFFDVTATYCGAAPAQNTASVNLPWFSGWTKPRN